MIWFGGTVKPDNPWVQHGKYKRGEILGTTSVLSYLWGFFLGFSSPARLN
jgi:hypothetical protein